MQEDPVIVENDSPTNISPTTRKTRKRKQPQNPLPKCFYVRINHDTVLPVQVFDHHKCNIASKKRIKKSNGTSTQAEEIIWFEKTHEAELHTILKPFLDQNLFQQNEESEESQVEDDD